MAEQTDNEIEIAECYPMTDWDAVQKAAHSTIKGFKSKGKKDVLSKWKSDILLAQHSPIRCRIFWVKFKCKSWVSVHLVRHKYGIEHFVESQRNDRQGQYDRNAARQDTPVYHSFMVNAQEVIFISQRRLCAKASPETRAAWKQIVDAIGKYDPELKQLCHPPCWWYGGRCPEMKPCGMFPKFDPTFSPVPLAKVGK